MLTNKQAFADNPSVSVYSDLELRVLPLDLLIPSSRQPRKFFDKQQLQELADSIKENGVLQPVLVRKVEDYFQIVSGERRFKASKLAGLKHIPVVIRKLNEQETMLASLIENIQRQDLNPIEEARALRKIILEHGLTHDELAGKVGKSRSALTNRLRLLQLPSDVQKLIASREITVGHAKILAGVRDISRIRSLTKKITTEKLSVYETEKLVATSKQSLPQVGHRKESQGMRTDLHVKAVEESLQELLGAKVRIKRAKNKGRIEIEFYNSEDLDRVVETMLSVNNNY